jgi:hypothetical protein
MKFFNVITQGQTYLNLIYLLLSFPLGIFYFVVLVTGLSLGLGLIITLLGIPILFGIGLLWRQLAKFEIQLTKTMLNIDISSTSLQQVTGLKEKIKAYLSDSFTWKSLVYLLLRFPIGIISFVLLVTLLSVSLSLIATPILYHLTQIGLIQGTYCINEVCFLDSYFASFIISLLGIFLLFVSLHALNGLTRAFGMMTKVMLQD